MLNVQQENNGTPQAIMPSHMGHTINSCFVTSAYLIFRIKISVKIFYHRCMGQRRDHCSRSMYVTRPQVDLRGEQNVCALCNCGSVQRHSGHDVNPILTEKSTFNITFSSPLGNFRFSPPLTFFLKDRNNSSNPQI